MINRVPQFGQITYREVTQVGNEKFLWVNYQDGDLKKVEKGLPSFTYVEHRPHTNGGRAKFQLNVSNFNWQAANAAEKFGQYVTNLFGENKDRSLS